MIKDYCVVEGEANPAMERKERKESRFRSRPASFSDFA